MPATEVRRLDKFVNKAFLGKREIGRPMKYNIRNQGRTGWVELVFNPRTRVQEYVSDAIKFAHPYIFAMTYKFHVEKAKEAGEYPFFFTERTQPRERNEGGQSNPKSPKWIARLSPIKLPHVPRPGSPAPPFAALSRLSNAHKSSLFNYYYRYAH